MRKTFATCLTLLLLAALPAAGAPAGRLAVMTQNLYIGADVFRVLEVETLDEIPLVVAEILGIALASDFPARAAAIADEVAGVRPDLIGLQEVSLVRLQSPGDFFDGNPLPAEDVLLDYLEILQAALAARGLDYEVAAVVENADIELPLFAGFDEDGLPLFDDARLTDRDVILAASGVATSNVLARNYSVNLEIPLGDLVIPFLRGFVAVDATVKGRQYRFVNTHLETAGLVPEIQSAQTLELLAELAGETRPVVLVGDLNSAPEDPPTQPYALLAGAGFEDVWLRRSGPADPGFTSCQEEFLDNPVSLLDSRIDHLFVRGSGAPELVGRPRAEVTGDDPADRTPSGLWPSDHGGVFAKMILRAGGP